MLLAVAQPEGRIGLRAAWDAVARLLEARERLGIEQYQLLIAVVEG